MKNSIRFSLNLLFLVSYRLSWISISRLRTFFLTFTILFRRVFFCNSNEWKKSDHIFLVTRYFLDISLSLFLSRSFRFLFLLWKFVVLTAFWVHCTRYDWNTFSQLQKKKHLPYWIYIYGKWMWQKKNHLLKWRNTFFFSAFQMGFIFIWREKKSLAALQRGFTKTESATFAE